MNNKRIYGNRVLFSLVVVFVFFSFVPGLINSNAITNSLNSVDRFPIIETPDVELKLIEKVERFNEQADEIKEVYSIKIKDRIIGYLLYDSYTFNNGDLYYYLKYEPEGLNPRAISVMLPLPLMNMT